MLLQVDRLPKLTLVNEEGQQTFAVRDRIDRAYGIASFLRERYADTSCRIVGLVFPTSEALLVNWFGVILAGMEPCVLQYPTRKTNRNYYEASLAASVRDCGVNLVLHSGEIQSDTFQHLILPEISPRHYESDSIEVRSIIQLSSGTTGTRKGIRFTGEQLARHAKNYNRRLNLNPSTDTIVSWLPLYHDMGFIACWCMPLYLGVPVVMMDPMHWIRNPQTLFDVIEGESPTVTFMPNFAFEVMARRGERRNLSSIREWISCSEPTRPRSIRHFSEATGVALDRISNCYAMAENVFAISQSRGLDVVEVDGKEIASCGTAIQGTEIRIKGEEIWVRSPHSLGTYLSAPGGLDVDGFYPTGDLGFVRDGRLFVTGRSRDIINIAGRKYIASDIDDTLQDLYPEARGREAALPIDSGLTGTESVVMAIEADRFWQKNFSELAGRLSSKTGIEGVEVVGVPNGFLTKTTSGKINRKVSAADYVRTLAPSAQPRRERSRVRSEITKLFGNLPADMPCSEALDSLGLTTLRILLEGQNIPYRSGYTLRDLLALIDSRVSESATREEKTFNIVACTDKNYYPFIDEGFLRMISSLVGVPVNYEHVCVPPTPVLINDLIFEQWFAPRQPHLKLDGVRYALDRLRNASLVLIDDCAELYWPHQVPGTYYPVLSHSFRRDPAANYLAVRWARYTWNHDELPIELMSGASVDRDGVNHRIEDLAALLGTVVARVAIRPSLAQWTADWDIQAHMDDDIDCAEIPPDISTRSQKIRNELMAGLCRFISEKQNELDYSTGTDRFAIKAADQPHFCSWLVPHDAIEAATRRHHEYVICGMSSSLPILRRIMEAKGRRYSYSTSLDVSRVPHDAVIQTGSWGKPNTNKPIYMLMSSGSSDRLIQASTEEIASFPPVFGDPETIISFARQSQTSAQAVIPPFSPREHPAMKPHLESLVETSFFLQLMDMIAITHRRCRNLPVLRTAIVGTDRQVLDTTEALADSGYVIRGFFGGNPNDRYHPSRPWSEFHAADYDILLLAPGSKDEYNRQAKGLLDHYLNQPHAGCPLLHVPGIRDGLRAALESINSLPTCLNLRKLCVIASLLAQTKGGKVAECGSFMGGTALLMGSLLRQWQDTRTVLAFDTFEGMPAPVEKDGNTVYVAGLFTETSYQRVVDLMAVHSLSTRVSVHKGLVQDNLPRVLTANDSLSFSLVDTDQYLGTIESLKQIVPRLAMNGLIVVDDYGVSGVRLAVDEAKALFPSLNGALLTENFYVLWNKANEHFLSNTSD